MRLLILTAALCLIAPLDADAQNAQRQTYKWVDDEGVIHYGDSVPPEFSELRKEVVNDHGVVVTRAAVSRAEDRPPPR